MLYVLLSICFLCLLSCAVRYYFGDPVAMSFHPNTGPSDKHVRVMRKVEAALYRQRDAARVAKMRSTRAHDKLVWEHKRATIEHVKRQQDFSRMWDGCVNLGHDT